MITRAIVADNVDAGLIGSCRLVIPELTGSGTETVRARICQPPGSHFPYKVGDAVLVVVLECFEEVFVYMLGAIPSYDPQGVPSSPGASVQSDPTGANSATEQASFRCIEVAKKPAEKFQVRIRGEDIYFEVDADTKKITIEPGAYDVIVGDGSTRVAVQGDIVEVVIGGIPYQGIIKTATAKIMSEKI